MTEYRIPLDPRNPGQYFACCGLFELSELIAPGGEAGFEEEGRVFVIVTDAPVPPRGLRLEPPMDGECDAALEPLTLTAGGRPLALNWWLNHVRTKKSAFKTWGGQQTPRRVLAALLALLDSGVSAGQLLDFPAVTKSRFGVDARSAWEALDIGYSPNDLNQDAVTFPWVEVLAVAGLQGFRPAEDIRFHHRYSLWLHPLPLVTARAACAAPWPGLPSRTFRFEIATRGQGYKTFLFAEGVDDG